MRKPLLVLLAISCLLFSCKDPEWKEEYSWDVDSIPGTLKTQLPLTWEKGTYGGTWHDTYADDPKSFNPFSNLDGSYTTVTNLILDYLFDYDPDTKEWSGNIVESYRVETDLEHDTIDLYCRLRSNILWSDGVRMTADDVVWYFENIENNKEIYPLGEQGLYITMPDGSRKKYTIEKLGEFEFCYHFPRIVSEPLLVVNTGNIVARHIWEPVLRQGKKAVESFWGINTPPEELVGNGPFLLEKLIPGERIIFRRNPNYWKKDSWGQPLPYIDRIVMTYTPDPNSDLLKFQKGETDAYFLRGQDLPTLLPESGKGKFDIWNGGPATVYTALLFNHNPESLPDYKFKLFSNVKFKQAVSCLIDRHTIINQTTNGLSQPQYNAVGENNRYYDPESDTPYTYNPELAKKILEDAGYTDRNGDGIREDEEGNPLSFSILTWSTDPVTHDYLNIIISDLEKAGIKALLQTADYNVIAQKLLNTLDWECYLAGMSMPTFPEQWYNIWLSSGNLHYWHPKQSQPTLEWEKKIDYLYNQLIYTYDQAEIQKNYSLFQKTLMEELVIIPIFRRYSFMAADSHWGNLNWSAHNSAGDNFRYLYRRDLE